MVSVPLFTVGFPHPGDWFFPYTAIDYWWGQHSIERVAGPPWFHLPRLALYEFLPILAGLAWAVRRGRRMGVVERSLVVFRPGFGGHVRLPGREGPVAGSPPGVGLLAAGRSPTRADLRTEGSVVEPLAGRRRIGGDGAHDHGRQFVLDEISPNRPRVEALTYVQTCPEVLPPVRRGNRAGGRGKDPGGGCRRRSRLALQLVLAGRSGAGGRIPIPGCALRWCSAIRMKNVRSAAVSAPATAARKSRYGAGGSWPTRSRPSERS